MRLIKLLTIIIFIIMGSIVSAQGFSNIGSVPKFGMNMGLSSHFIENSFTGESEPWYKMSLQPEFVIGKFGIGLALDLNFALEQKNGSPGFRIREEDWIPNAEEMRSVLDIYLPIIQYIRYGFKGDPLYIAFGELNSFRLGNGFIVSGYANTELSSEYKQIGFAFDLDGDLFNFPYIGIETMVSNVARFNLFGGRIYARPLNSIKGVVKDLQLGFTAVIDRNPFNFIKTSNFWDQYKSSANDAGLDINFDASNSVFIFGTDLTLPLVKQEGVNFVLFGDIVSQNTNLGAMVGISGKFFNFLTYGFQVRIMDQNFIPSYFDEYYDLYRAERYKAYNTGKKAAVIPARNDWVVQLGIDALNKMIIFDAILTAPFEINKNGSNFMFPTFSATFHLDPTLLAGLGIDLSYQKEYIKTVADLLSPEDSVIAAAISYNIGGVSISLVYDLKYDPTPGTDQMNEDGSFRHWDVNAKLETSFALF